VNVSAGRGNYPGHMTIEGRDVGSTPITPRRFGQLPKLVVPDDFDEPLPPAEAAVWEEPGSASGDASAAADDWPVDVEHLRDALRESEGDQTTRPAGGPPTAR